MVKKIFSYLNRGYSAWTIRNTSVWPNSRMESGQFDEHRTKFDLISNWNRLINIKRFTRKSFNICVDQIRINFDVNQTATSEHQIEFSLIPIGPPFIHSRKPQRRKKILYYFYFVILPFLFCYPLLFKHMWCKKPTNWNWNLLSVIYLYIILNFFR